jgi:hypothetical protein
MTKSKSLLTLCLVIEASFDQVIFRFFKEQNPAKAGENVVRIQVHLGLRDSHLLSY